MSKPRRVCANCGHDVSVHQYKPGSDVKAGPKDCRLCVCTEYRRPLPYERIKKLPVTKV